MESSRENRLQPELSAVKQEIAAAWETLSPENRLRLIRYLTELVQRSAAADTPEHPGPDHPAKQTTGEAVHP